MNTYPLRILSLGAGVQSTTLFLMSLHDELPKPDHVIFADTGWEPRRVYEHVDRLRNLAAQHEIPFHVVSSGNIRADFMSTETHFASMPLFVRNEQGKTAMLRRQCTSEYKLKPILAKQRELAGLRPRQRSVEHRITTVIGISYDEVQRMRDPAFPWIVHEYPLVDRRLTRADCLDWCDKHGYARPPRSACVGCPFRGTDEWIALRADKRDWEDAVEFDAALRANQRLASRFQGEAYLHRSAKPLTEVDFRTDEEKGHVSLFQGECEGMCGL